MDHPLIFHGDNACIAVALCIVMGVWYLPTVCYLSTQTVTRSCINTLVNYAVSIVLITIALSPVYSLFHHLMG